MPENPVVTNITPIKDLTSGKPLPKDMIDDYLEDPDAKPEAFSTWALLSKYNKWRKASTHTGMLLLGVQAIWLPQLIALALIAVLVVAFVVMKLVMRFLGARADVAAEKAHQNWHKQVKPVNHNHNHEQVA